MRDFLAPDRYFTRCIADKSITMKIPDGYRILAPGTLIETGDLVPCYGVGAQNLWVKTELGGTGAIVHAGGPCYVRQIADKTIDQALEHLPEDSLARRQLANLRAMVIKGYRERPDYEQKICALETEVTRLKDLVRTFCSTTANFLREDFFVG